MSKLRAALLGTGNIARQHLRGLRAHPEEVDLVAVLDADRARAAAFAKEHGIPQVHAELDVLLAEARPDLVHPAKFSRTARHRLPRRRGPCAL